MARIQPLTQYVANSPVFQPEALTSASAELKQRLNPKASGNALRNQLLQLRAQNSQQRTINQGKTVHIGSISIQMNGELDAERLLNELEMAS